MRICKWVAVCEIYLIMVILECVGPSQREVSLQETSTLAIPVLIVFNILTCTMPTYIILC
jgi:hypothetical protein